MRDLGEWGLLRRTRVLGSGEGGAKGESCWQKAAGKIEGTCDGGGSKVLKARGNAASSRECVRREAPGSEARGAKVRVKMVVVKRERSNERIGTWRQKHRE